MIYVDIVSPRGGTPRSPDYIMHQEHWTHPHDFGGRDGNHTPLGSRSPYQSPSHHSQRWDIHDAQVHVPDRWRSPLLEHIIDSRIPKSLEKTQKLYNCDIT